MNLKPTQFLLAALLPFMLYSCAVVKPPAPVANQPEDLPKLVQPVSNIEVPVTVDLKSYFVQAETSVPNKYADAQNPCEGLSYAYTFTRSPFMITGSSNVANLKFTGSYSIAASYCPKCADLFNRGPKCITPVVSAQCGVGEAPRRMEISYQSTFNISPDFKLSSKTILYPAPKPIDRCNILMGNIDVTDKLIDYLKGPLGDLGKQVDAKIAAYNVKPIVEQLWKNMASEIKLADVGYLSINPQTVRLSKFSLNGSQLNFSVGLSAKPVVTTASANLPVKALPNLTSYTPANGFSIYLDLVENYKHLSDVVSQQVVGQAAEVAGKSFVVDATKVYGIGKQVVMQIDFKGSNTGTIYLVGTPTYSNTTHEISFPDLTFDLQTKAWILKAAKWMFNEKITNMIRQKATYNLTQFIAESKTKIQSEIANNPNKNTRPEVSIKDMDIMAVYPTSDKLIIRTLFNGQIKVKAVM